MGRGGGEREGMASTRVQEPFYGIDGRLLHAVELSLFINVMPINEQHVKEEKKKIK